MIFRTVLIGMLGAAIFLSGCGKVASVLDSTPTTDSTIVIRSFNFKSDTYQVSVGGLLNLVSEISPALSANELRWSVEDPSIATVDASGTVEGLVAGSTVVTAVLAANNLVVRSIAFNVSSTANLRLSQSELTIYKGDTFTLRVQGNELADVRWISSSGNAVRLIDRGDSGYIAGESVGTSILTAIERSSGSAIGSCRVTVESKVRSISIYPRSFTVPPGTEFEVSASLVVVDDTVDKGVTWYTSNSNVVSLLLDGNARVVGFKARSTGTATLTALSNASTEVVASTVVTVSSAQSSGISVFPKQTSVARGKTVTLFSTTDTSAPTTWESSNTSVATVSSSGVVTGIQVGTVTITVTSTPNAATASVTVIDPSVSEVLVSPRSAALNLSQVQSLAATVYPTSLSQTVVWSVSDSSILELDTRLKPPTVTARKPGSARIFATSTVNPAYVGISDVVVLSPPVTSVSLSPSSLTIYQGQSSNLTATVLPSTTDKSITWRSLDVVVAEVVNGVVTGRSAGTTQIEARSSFDTTKYARITVVVNPIDIQSVAISPSRVDTLVGMSTTLTATVVPSTVSAVKWKSSNDDIVRVSSKGKILAVGPSLQGTTVRASSVGDDTKVADSRIVVSTPAGSIGFTVYNRSYWGPNLGDPVQRIAFLNADEIQKIKDQNSVSGTEWLSGIDNTNYLYIVAYIDETASNLYGFIQSITYSSTTGLTANLTLAVDPQYPVTDPILPNHGYVRVVLRVSKTEDRNGRITVNTPIRLATN